MSLFSRDFGQRWDPYKRVPATAATAGATVTSSIEQGNLVADTKPAARGR